LPQARCIVFVPALYYPALSYTEDANNFYLYPLARRANSSKLTLMSSARAPAACHPVPFGYHIFNHAVAVGECCEPFLDEPLYVLTSNQLGVGGGVVDVVGSEDLISYVWVSRI
jgi:hypothetical protein